MSNGLAETEVEGRIYAPHVKKTVFPGQDLAKDIAQFPGVDKDLNIDVLKSKKNGIIVAIPCLNEEVAIGSVVLRAKKYADSVVVIDDGSNDSTAEIAKLAGAHVIKHENNQGKGAAIRDAFDYAKLHGAEILVLIDGDRQHNTDDIPGLVMPILSGEADMVNGSRFLVKNGHRVPAYRGWARKC
jgi:glycosyltransferase involved in cell wall biosynthesis